MISPDRFLEKVSKTDSCWIWTGGHGAYGYGILRPTGLNEPSALPEYAHRVSYRLFTGEIPKGMLVLHKCDNVQCVNPAHLSLGTNQDNQLDKVVKGRQAKGESNGMAKLTDSKALEIIRADGRLKDIANSFGVSISVVSQIKSGKIWKHLNKNIHGAVNVQ